MEGHGYGDVKAVAEEVRRRLSPARFAHVEGVVQSAAELARRWGVSEDKAVLAAWLHDVAKELPPEALLRLADEFGIIFDDEMKHMPQLWHAPVGAELARRDFGVTDEDVLSAIRYHTTGRAGMSALEAIVFLADLIEPGRTFPGVEELRRLSREDLNAALLAAYDGLIRYVLDQGGLLHSATTAARNDLLLRQS
ncbi:MAG: bis(5'-nucleosyl)-tetraphosphatase (symmetrical) YqeK [Limnochordales bacterium]|jgi:putative HD superfamily hydrolase of NAD metabolism|nr:phosphohydrolase [Bacillota bacterium]